MHRSSAISLVIPDVDGQLSGLQLLVAVRHTAAPDINVLHRDKKDVMELDGSCTGEIKACHALMVAAHLAQVNNKAVPLVEVGPGQVLLRCPDGPATLDVQQTLHVGLIGHHVLKTRGHAPFLGQKKQ